MTRTFRAKLISGLLGLTLATAAALMPAGSVWAADYGAAPALLSSGSLDDTVQSAVEEGQKRLGIRISDRAKAEMNDALRTLREWGIAPSAATENIKALIVRQLGWDTPEETESEEEPADTEILFGNEHAGAEETVSEDNEDTPISDGATDGDLAAGEENAVAGNDSEISAEPAGNSTPAVSEGAENNSNTTILEETTDAIRDSLEENSQNFFRQSTEAIRQAIVRFFKDLLTK